MSFWHRLFYPLTLSLRIAHVLLQFSRNADLLQFLREKRFVVWAGDVKESEAFVVSNTLLTTRFPFLALIAPQSSSRMVVVDRFEGPLTPAVLISSLTIQLDRVNTVLTNVRLDRERLDQSRTLRDAQDDAYNASLRADQEKARLALEATQRAQQEKEECDRREREIAEKRESKRLRKIFLTEHLEAEPELTGVGEVAKIGIRLPSGERVTRRFLATASIQDIYDFIETLNLTPIELDSDFEVINTYPRRVLTNKSETVKEAGLFPNASVMVEEMDKE
ncbi:hypothetical protein HDU98_007777 [Podochytrium sp. JEL0797]|nr:hypothetical protein HDU98_007777 [Podochytrium sp. JEL0797]